MRQVELTPEINAALSLGLDCVVAIGVSGGKDSTAVALATVAHLKSIDFQGRTVLIHSDLGKTEWNQSIVKCRELAFHLGLELIVVRRKAGGMMERWQGRWKANVKRFKNLECVKLILPWSTPGMRFCTSELKVAPICSELKKRFRGQMIVNVVGIRRLESCGRANAPISKSNAKLKHKTVDATTGRATDGYDWNAIATWTLDDVFESIEEAGLTLHEAYTIFGLSRVSCKFCILQNKCDQENATKPAESHDLYREQVDLEIASTFSFQSGGWLGDVSPYLLSTEQRLQLEEAKVKAEARECLDKQIPKHLLYVKGWPHSIPTEEEAILLSAHRRDVAKVMGLDVKYTTAEDVIARYTELMALKDSKAKKKVA